MKSNVRTTVPYRCYSSVSAQRNDAVEHLSLRNTGSSPIGAVSMWVLNVDLCVRKYLQSKTNTQYSVACEDTHIF